MTPRISRVVGFGCVALAQCLTTIMLAAEPTDGQPAAPPEAFRGALLRPEKASNARLADLRLAGIRAVALQIDDNADARPAERRACDRIRQAKLPLYYWIEIARCPSLADSHPQWMASLQGHGEWRRLFNDPPKPREGEVVKTFPWVPILNKEPFEAQLARVAAVLNALPRPDGLFLNDLQGAPSACGCGNHLCRWTTDYGPIRTTTPLGHDAAAAFVAEVRRLVPEAEVIPVWTTECEEHDATDDGLCAGVGCFEGICWKAYTEQLMPVAIQNPRLGVLLPYRAFQRDLALYGQPAGWIRHAARSFQTMPARYERGPIPSDRLIAVLQGWDVTDEQVAAQIEAAEAAGTGGYLIAFANIEQGWEPRIVKWK